jgi:hypothetical protein
MGDEGSGVGRLVDMGRDREGRGVIGFSAFAD